MRYVECSGGMVGARRVLADQFSTTELRQVDRHEAWRERGRPSIGLVYETRPTEPFEVSTTAYALGALAFGSSRFSGQTYDRTPAMARTGEFDHLAICLHLSGEATGDADGRGWRQRAGEISFLDAAQSGRHISTATETIWMAIPRAVGVGAGLAVEALHGAVLAPREAVLLASHMAALRTALPSQPAETATLHGQVLLDLIGATLAGAGRGATSRPTTAPPANVLAARAKREIAAALWSTRLSVGWLTARLGVSRSTLHRIFAIDGGVNAYVREQRLLLAARVLLEQPQIGIGDLGERLGFSDVSHFSRTFKARFGRSPRDFRTDVRVDE